MLQRFAYICDTEPPTHVMPNQVVVVPLQTFPEFHPVFVVQVAPPVAVYILVRAVVSAQKFNKYVFSHLVAGKTWNFQYLLLNSLNWTSFLPAVTTTCEKTRPICLYIIAKISVNRRRISAIHENRTYDLIPYNINTAEYFVNSSAEYGATYHI